MWPCRSFVITYATDDSMKLYQYDLLSETVQSLWFFSGSQVVNKKLSNFSHSKWVHIKRIWLRFIENFIIFNKISYLMTFWWQLENKLGRKLQIKRANFLLMILYGKIMQKKKKWNFPKKIPKKIFFFAIFFCKITKWPGFSRIGALNRITK